MNVEVKHSCQYRGFPKTPKIPKVPKKSTQTSQGGLGWVMCWIWVGLDWFELWNGLGCFGFGWFWVIRVRLGSLGWVSEVGLGSLGSLGSLCVLGKPQQIGFIRNEKSSILT